MAHTAPIWKIQEQQESIKALEKAGFHQRQQLYYLYKYSSALKNNPALTHQEWLTQLDDLMILDKMLT